jgi:beta-1,2-N-acetylglucosaminyltransferase
MLEVKLKYCVLISLFLFQCFKIWDLDARGYHKSMWRMHMKGSEMLVIGVPNSEYA